MSVAIVFSACSSEPPPDLTGLDPKISAASSSSDDLAKQLASGLNDPQVAKQLQVVLQNSPWTEHKIVLSELLQTQAGAALVGRASEVSRVSSQTLMSRLLALPEMDVYLPFDEHRKTWRGETDILVGITMDVDDPVLIAYAPAGEQTVLHARNGLPEQPLLILHPAEIKSLRADSNASAFRVSLETSHRLPEGDFDRGMVLQQECTEETCPGGGGGADMEPNLINHRFWIYKWFESWGDMEIRFQYTDNNNQPVNTVTHHEVQDIFTQVTWDRTITWTYVGNPQPTTAVLVTVWEEDDYPGGSDDYVGTGFVRDGFTDIIGDGGFINAEIDHDADPAP